MHVSSYYWKDTIIVMLETIIGIIAFFAIIQFVKGIVFGKSIQTKKIDPNKKWYEKW